jgi:hypothetical protein
MMNVHFQLATLKKGNSSIMDYYQQFQQLADVLAAVNKPLSHFEMVSFPHHFVGACEGKICDERCREDIRLPNQTE